MAYLNQIAYHLPEGLLTNEDINERFPEWSVDKISAKTGIHQRHIAGPDEYASDLAVAAAEKLFDQHPEVRAEIDFVLYCTQSPDYFLPTTACILQDRLGLSTACGALDFNLGCSGYVYGLGLAKGLIASGQAKKILLLTGETYSKFLGENDKSNRTIFGDAASASVLSNEAVGFAIGNFFYGTDGSGYDKLIVRGGGIRNRGKAVESYTDTYGNERTDNDLYMDGQGVFAFTIKSVPKLIRGTLGANELSLAEVHHFVFHQANRFMLNHLRKKLKIAEDRMVIDMEDCGNTVSATIPIALTRSIEQNRFTPNQKIVLAGFGVGLSTGGCCLTYV